MFPTRYRLNADGQNDIGPMWFTISNRYTRDIGPMIARYRFADWDCTQDNSCFKIDITIFI